ncbi:hypothetical protein Dda_8114 [Drechslerella dactyloides]|uniref:Uncharacterized protein n=1 Tax=Drechslerella dactyloides TaxID=74499 RepID=A0AAD6IRV4_DREDA|nr:hypothetical protein Dda_8114 [Drechslerella dactyloides]
MMSAGSDLSIPTEPAPWNRPRAGGTRLSGKDRRDVPLKSQEQGTRSPYARRLQVDIRSDVPGAWTTSHHGDQSFEVVAQIRRCIRDGKGTATGLEGALLTPYHTYQPKRTSAYEVLVTMSMYTDVRAIAIHRVGARQSHRLPNHVADLESDEFVSSSKQQQQQQPGHAGLITHRLRPEG